MQQRLSIAQSVICDQDTAVGRTLRGVGSGRYIGYATLILELWNMNKMTVFMVTHDLQESFALGTGSWYSIRCA